LVQREDKFDVDPDWVLPQVMGLGPDGGCVDQEVRRLENTYFDTPGAGLRVFGVTLRRVGGSGSGLAIEGSPNGTARTELQSGSRTKRLPAALAKGVAGLRAGEALQPVAMIVTTRTAYRLMDADARELVAAYVAAQCHVLASIDVGLRIGAPEVHQTRVGARRLRSTLRIFGDVVDAAAAAER
jgi:inorganic triphosphatase YgiF